MKDRKIRCSDMMNRDAMDGGMNTHRVVHDGGRVKVVRFELSPLTPVFGRWLHTHTYTHTSEFCALIG